MVYLHVTNYPRPSSLFDSPPPCNYNVHIRGRRPGTEATQVKKVYPNEKGIPKWKRYTQMKQVYPNEKGIPKWNRYIYQNEKGYQNEAGIPKWKRYTQMKQVYPNEKGIPKYYLRIPNLTHMYNSVILTLISPHTVHDTNHPCGTKKYATADSTVST